MTIRGYASPEDVYIEMGRIFLYAWRLEGALVLVVLALTACASRHTVDGFLVDEARGFRIPMLRNGWQQLEVEGAELAFQAKPGGQIAALLVSCEEEQPVTLRMLARHLFFGIGQKRVVTQDVVPLNGTEAVHTVLTGRLAESDVTISSYVAADGECVYDLVYVASPEAFHNRLPEFERFVQGWVFTEKDSGIQVPTSDAR